MDESNQLEDGEIEDVSDKEVQDIPIIEEISEPEEEKANINTELKSDNQKVIQQHGRSSHSFLSWEEYSKTKRHVNSTSRAKRIVKTNKKSNGLEDVYDMDDYQLLLARHQLIQQQLTKVKRQEPKAKSKFKSKKGSRNLIHRKRRNSEKVLTTSSSLTNTTDFLQTDTQNLNEESPVTATSSHSEPVIQVPEDDEDLSEMRNLLLAQTMRKKDVSSKAKSSEETLSPSMTPTSSVDVKNDSSLNDKPCSSTDTETNLIPMESSSTNQLDTITDNDVKLNTENVRLKSSVQKINTVEVIDISDGDDDPEIVCVKSTTPSKSPQVTEIRKVHIKPPVSNSSTAVNIKSASANSSADVNQTISNPPASVITQPTPSSSLNPARPLLQNVPHSNAPLQFQKYPTLKESLKEHKKRSAHIKNKESEQASPRTIITRSRAKNSSNKKSDDYFNSRQSSNRQSTRNLTGSSNQYQPSPQPEKKRRRKRAGKRTRMLAFRAQQRKELNILQKEQEKVDNYSHVPMDIDDDSTELSEGSAPLPLIETTEVIPPPPPTEFEPVLDQTALSMTENNVAWMPGYVESFEKPVVDSVALDSTNKNNDSNTTVTSSPIAQSNSPSEVEKSTEDDNKTNKNDENENEVWALRAQALKSLACKRATKVKQLKKEKKSVVNEKSPTSSLKESLSQPSSPLSIPSLPPSPLVGNYTGSPVKIAPKKIAKPTNINSLQPPKHVPVIIQLSKDDFGLSDNDDDNDGIVGQLPSVNKSAVNLMRYKKKQIQNQPSKMLSARRKSVSDENLLKELQSITDKTSDKMKQHSSHIVKDQLSYKRLQAEIVSQRSLFDQQSQAVKELQEKLNEAMKQKTTTRRLHNRLHGRIKVVKERLKKNLGVKKQAEEEILRAKSIVSVNRLKLTGKGTITDKMKENISTLVGSLQSSCKKVVGAIESSIDESSQDETDFNIEKLSSTFLGSSSERAKSELKKTAADVKTMNKTDLTRLELELREQLKKYRSTAQSNSSLSTTDMSTDENRMTLSIVSLPSVKAVSQLKKLQVGLIMFTGRNVDFHRKMVLYKDVDVKIQKNLSSHLQRKTRPSNNTIMQDFLRMKNDTLKLRELPISSDQLDKVNSSEEDTLVYHKRQDKTFTKYKTVLTRFRSYRLNPYYRTQSKHTIQSSTFTHRIHPHSVMCKYDLLGTCNDDTCQYWHYRDKCSLPLEKIVKDLVAYDLHAFNATPDMSNEMKCKLLDSFTQQFFQLYEGKMSPDEKILLLWNQLKESRRSRTQESIVFHKRDWFLQTSKASKTSSNDFNVEQYERPNNQVYFLKKKKKENVAIDNEEISESQEVRYFSEAYSSIEVLKTALSENPSDIKLWLTLSNFYLKQERSSKNQDKKENKKISDDKTTPAEESSNLENALAILSQGLEENRDSEELWIRYLKLFSKNSCADELRELCYQAVMYAATYKVWWTCLNLETSYSAQQEICTEMIKFVLESEELLDTKSHYLLESVLFVAQLLMFRGKTKMAVSYISSALGRDELKDENEKLEIVDITSYLSETDKSLLWICLISLHVFQTLPTCLFHDEIQAPGPIVRKQKFLLDWKNSTWNIDEKTIRDLFNAALTTKTKPSKSTIKSMMILHENMVAFETSLQNIQAAVTHIRCLLNEECSLVEGWTVLLSLYVKHSPVDAVVIIAEEAIHNCEYDVEIIYFYTQWLYKQNMPSLALEKLTKCIYTYFQFEPSDTDIPDVFHLYRKLLGLPVPHTIKLSAYLPDLKSSQHLALYYWLCYCLLLKIRKIPPSILIYSSSIEEAYESAVHQYTSRDNTKKLWYSYLQESIEVLLQKDHVSLQEYQNFEDLVFRCLSSVHASTVLPYDKTFNWKDYHFHNKVLDLCLSVIPKNKHSAIYRKAIRFMPDNVTLAIRICNHEYNDGNYEQTRVICAALLSNHPQCLDLWCMAIKVELKFNCVKEARWLYKEACKALPFSSTLWKDYSSFEIAYTTRYDQIDSVLKEIVTNAKQHGVDLEEPIADLKPS